MSVYTTLPKPKGSHWIVSTLKFCLYKLISKLLLHLNVPCMWGVETNSGNSITDLNTVMQSIFDLLLWSWVVILCPIFQVAPKLTVMPAVLTKAT